MHADTGSSLSLASADLATEATQKGDADNSALDPDTSVASKIHFQSRSQGKQTTRLLCGRAVFRLTIRRTPNFVPHSLTIQSRVSCPGRLIRYPIWQMDGLVTIH